MKRGKRVPEKPAFWERGGTGVKVKLCIRRTKSLVSTKADEYLKELKNG